MILLGNNGKLAGLYSFILISAFDINGLNFSTKNQDCQIG